MNKRKKIALFTSTRAEYGSLNFLLKELYREDIFDIELLVGGSHLLREYGYTLREIEEDGHFIFKKFPFLFTDQENDCLPRSMSFLAFQIGQYFADFHPDIVVLLGDRFELLPVANAALVMRIPIAHVSGGEITEGAIDNQIRNSVSQIADIHLVATENSKANLIAMGIRSDKICISGELGLDEIADMDFIPWQELFASLGLDPTKKLVLATFHPETVGGKITKEFIKETYLRIISEFLEVQILCTASNFDQGGQSINDLLQELSEAYRDIFYVQSLGKRRYYSILMNTMMVLGNSSSGIYEVQSFNIPTINVGNRQKGRLSNPNVLTVDADTESIIAAMKNVQEEEFRSTFLNRANVYGVGDSAKKMVNFLKYYIGEQDDLN